MMTPEMQRIIEAAEQCQSDSSDTLLRPLRIMQKALNVRRRLRRDEVSERFRERLTARNDRQLLHRIREGRQLCWLPEEVDEPLVTIRIATYNRGAVVADRAIASALSQTYRNIEVLVIGDNCDQAAETAVRAVDDERVRFINLPRRGAYPSDPKALWLVGGVHPMNAALALARGAWIAPCDDDDELTPNHVDRLLAAIRDQRVEFIYSRAAMKGEDGRWTSVGRYPPARGAISHGTVMYSSRLAPFTYSADAWRLREPADWNLWKRMQRAGVSFGFIDEITYLHY